VRDKRNKAYDSRWPNDISLKWAKIHFYSILMLSIFGAFITFPESEL